MLRRFFGFRPLEELDTTVERDHDLEKRETAAANSIRNLEEEVFNKIDRVKVLAKSPSSAYGVLSTMSGMVRMVGEDRHD